MMESLNVIKGFTIENDHKKAVIRHAEMVFRLGKDTISKKNDLEDLRIRAKKILNSDQL